MIKCLSIFFAKEITSLKSFVSIKELISTSLAKIISNFLKLPHLSTGDILRSKIEQNDKISSKIKNIIANGKLVSDEILNQIVSEKITNDCDKGFILEIKLNLK